MGQQYEAAGLAQRSHTHRRLLPMKRYVLRLDEVSMDDVALVGGKTASIGELTRGRFTLAK